MDAIQRRQPPPLDDDVADEPQPAPVNGADQALRLAVIADGAPRRLDAARNGRVRDDASLPDLLDDLVARDDAIAVLDQQHEQIEHLRLDGDGRTIAAHLVGLGVDGNGADQIDHNQSSAIGPAPGVLEIICMHLRIEEPGRGRVAGGQAVPPGKATASHDLKSHRSVLFRRTRGAPADAS